VCAFGTFAINQLAEDVWIYLWVLYPTLLVYVLFWLLWVHSMFWNQVSWCLHHCTVLLRIALTIQGFLLCFHMNFRIFFLLDL
jgi:hypothetical protein